MSKSCKRCLLSDTIKGIRIDDDNLCDYCSGRTRDEWEERFHITEKKKTELFNEMNEIIQNIKGKQPYDCVLALSGGKDSSYLLYHLMKERGLNVLAVHVKISFESKVAKQNIERLQDKLRFDMEIIDPGEDFFIQFYKTLFQNPVQGGYLKSICYICGPFYIGCCLKIATEKKIPIVILGLSPNQPDNMFFRWGKDIIEKKDWIPDIFKTEEFTDDFRKKFWNPYEYPRGTKFPQLLAPLHVMKYDIKEIMRILSKNGLLPKRKLNPAITNCELNWPMMYLDSKLFGHNPYIKELSSVVRRGEGSRAFYKFMFTLLDTLIGLGLFKRKTIKEIEKKLNIKFNSCPQNKNDIKKIFKEYP